MTKHFKLGNNTSTYEYETDQASCLWQFLQNRSTWKKSLSQDAMRAVYFDRTCEALARKALDVHEHVLKNIDEDVVAMKYERNECDTQLNNGKNWLRRIVDEAELALYLPIEKESMGYACGVSDEVKRLRLFEVDVENQMWFVGGCVKALAWCPMLDFSICILNDSDYQHNCQYLALSTYPTMDQSLQFNDTQFAKGLVQLWNCGPLGLHPTLPNIPESLISELDGVEFPSFYCGVLHDFGQVLDIKWYPAGISTLTQRDKILGYLALACSTGIVAITPIPWLKQVNSGVIQHHMYKSDSWLLLTLAPTLSELHSEKRRAYGLATCLEWRVEFPNTILTGFSTGCVGIWDLRQYLEHDNFLNTFTTVFNSTLNVSSQLNLDYHPKHLAPFRIIQANYGPIFDIALDPITGHYFTVCGLARFITVWNFNEPCQPQMSFLPFHFAGSARNVFWPGQRPDTLLTLHEDNYGSDKLPSLALHLVHTPQRFTLRVSDYAGSGADLDYSDFLSSACFGTVLGELIFTSLAVNCCGKIGKDIDSSNRAMLADINKATKKLLKVCVVRKLNQEIGLEACACEKAGDMCYKCLQHQYNLQFCTSGIKDVKNSHIVDYSMFPAFMISRVGFSASPQASTWLAYGLRCGLMGLQCVDLCTPGMLIKVVELRGVCDLPLSYQEYLRSWEVFKLNAGSSKRKRNKKTSKNQGLQRMTSVEYEDTENGVNYDTTLLAGELYACHLDEDNRATSGAMRNRKKKRLNNEQGLKPITSKTKINDTNCDTLLDNQRTVNSTVGTRNGVKTLNKKQKISCNFAKEIKVASDSIAHVTKPRTIKVTKRHCQDISTDNPTNSDIESTDTGHFSNSCSLLFESCLSSATNKHSGKTSKLWAAMDNIDASTPTMEQPSALVRLKLARRISCLSDQSCNKSINNKNNVSFCKVRRTKILEKQHNVVTDRQKRKYTKAQHVLSKSLFCKPLTNNDDHLTDTMSLLSELKCEVDFESYEIKQEDISPERICHQKIDNNSAFIGNVMSTNVSNSSSGDLSNIANVPSCVANAILSEKIPAIIRNSLHVDTPTAELTNQVSGISTVTTMPCDLIMPNEERIFLRSTLKNCSTSVAVLNCSAESTHNNVISNDRHTDCSLTRKISNTRKKKRKDDM